jgi:2-oxoglutarate ferredoxin oxidoreductase subunit delta
MRPRSPINRHGSTMYIYLDSHRCRACWKCVESCPRGVIGKIDLLFHKHAGIRNAAKCKGCLKCVKACPQQAIVAYPVRERIRGEVNQ